MSKKGPSINSGLRKKISSNPYLETLKLAESYFQAACPKPSGPPAQSIGSPESGVPKKNAP